LTRLLALALALTTAAAIPASVATKPATTAKKPSTTNKKTTARRSRIPKPPKVSPQQRAEALETVESRVADARDLGIINAAAMVPFYERLYRQQAAAGSPLRILHFGDSHIAADDWPAAVRAKLQARFGDGGPGFIQAGRPYAGFRRFDARTAMSRRWEPAGLLKREGDGRYGLAGVAVDTSRGGETITLEAEGASVELFYWRQLGGGTFAVYDAGTELARISTDAEPGPGFARFKSEPGPRSLTLETAGAGPVRIFGWAVEKQGGVTWETLGINGAQADLLLGWDPELFTAHLARRDAALVILAYGTNEARAKDWTYETYRAMYAELLKRVRAAAPAASILVVGPPDHQVRVRGKWVPQPGIDRITTAQRDAALASGAAFWNLRAGMGGRGSMNTWVRAGLAQGDFIHFTSAGYRLLGEALYELLMGQFDLFTTVRKQLIGPAPQPSPVHTNGNTNGPPPPHH
jgi:lysophospholipase L1-like esterase